MLSAERAARRAPGRLRFRVRLHPAGHEYA
jgi:hypothetical protein